MGSARLQSVYLRTNDMRASRDFYEKLLGVEPSLSDGDQWTQYRLGSANFALAGERDRAGGTADTMAVIEVDNLSAISEAAASLGGEVLGRRDMGSHGEILTVVDPAGVMVQFFMRRSGGGSRSPA
jgi:predicted enzyme related to lactoylglutathione lyase